MWFTGYDEDMNFQIGYAFSTDGKSWTPNPSPVLSPTGNPGDFDESHVLDVSVLFEGGTYHVWYTGMDSEGNYAIAYTSTNSPDSLSNASEPLTNLQPMDTPDYLTHGVRAPNTIFTNDMYMMWPTAYGSRNTITVAQSDSPGTGWDINIAPVLTYHTTGFDVSQVGLCTVIEHPSAEGYEMWYTGWSASGLAIGYADSPDGITWNKYRD